MQSDGPSLLIGLDKAIGAISNPLRMLIAFVLVALVGVSDLLTGFEMSSSIFYLVPVALAAWYVGRRAGIVISALSAVVWYFVDGASGHQYSHSLIPVWNASVRMGFFTIVTLLLNRLQLSLNAQRSLATVDGLTGLLNARSFHAHASAVLANAGRRQAPIALGYLDIDGFKGVNDTRGHAAGDQILKAVAAILTNKARRGDLVARLGGDEFAVLLSDADSTSALVAFENLHQRLVQLASERQWPIGFSVGVATYAIPPDSTETAIGEADRAMYEVKRDGKNGVLLVKCGTSAPSA